ncbi:MAG: hypothetical protein ACOY94_24660 [Bacillota bacterium]
MQVRVVERWVEEAGRAQEAREHLRTLVRFLVVRRLLQEEPGPGQTPD